MSDTTTNATATVYVDVVTSPYQDEYEYGPDRCERLADTLCHWVSGWGWSRRTIAETEQGRMPPSTARYGLTMAPSEHQWAVRLGFTFRAGKLTRADELARDLVDYFTMHGWVGWHAGDHPPLWNVFVVHDDDTSERMGLVALGNNPSLLSIAAQLDDHLATLRKER